MPITPPRAVRLYSCCIDGQAVSRPFPHPGGLSAGELTSRLNEEFHTWLEAYAPGAHAAGRVHSIRFADMWE